VSLDGCVEPDPDNPTVFNEPKVIYRDFVLEGPTSAPPRLRCGHGYLVAEEDDTCESLARHLACWTVGWKRNRPGDRELILAAWRRALVRLNSRLPEGILPEGTRVYVVNSIRDDAAALRRARKSR
jgi:hypothetical protein